MAISDQQGDLYKSLIQAVTSSFSASDFCRHLVHSVLDSHEATAALICRLSLDSNFAEVGSYGLGVDGLQTQLTSVFDTSPLALAVRKHQTVFSETGTEMAIPLEQSGLLAGGLLITFEQPRAQEDLPNLLVDSLQIAGGHFIDKGRGTQSRAASHVPSPVQIQTELTPRQLQILGYLDQPLTYSQIGRLLHLSESLVKQESGRVFRFLDVNTRKDAVAVGLARELIHREQ